MKSLTLPWYLPSFYGDIRLETAGSVGDKTLVLYEGLTPSEGLAMKTLRKRALSRWQKKTWCLPSEFPEELGAASSGTIVLRATIDEVHAVLAKALKPGRSLVTAVRFSDSSLEEKTKDEASYRTSARDIEVKDVTPEDPKAEEKKDEKKKEATAIATVAQPVIGCPLPVFERAEVRATRVLEAFLSPEQLEDFRERQQYVAVGADTGHRYLLTSRHSPHVSAGHASFRSLYDLDEEHPLCVHDWVVPAAEELLGLTLFLSLPGRESYIRSLPPDE